MSVHAGEQQDEGSTDWLSNTFEASLDGVRAWSVHVAQRRLEQGEGRSVRSSVQSSSGEQAGSRNSSAAEFSSSRSRFAAAPGTIVHADSIVVDVGETEADA